MSRGISTNRNVTNRVGCLRQAGIDFVCRYYSTFTADHEKRLTGPEAQAISAAAMQVVAVYEDSPTNLHYFSSSRGHLDGVNAYHYANSIQQPSTSAIYFAVDYDADSGDVTGAISDYFRGVRQGFQDASQGNPIYDIGVYGSGLCCGWLKQHLGIAKYSWLAESTGWQGSHDYTDWDIKQAIAPAGNLCGLTGTVNGDYEANTGQQAGFGGFRVSTSAEMLAALTAKPKAAKKGAKAAAVVAPASIKAQIVQQAIIEWNFWGQSTPGHIHRTESDPVVVPHIETYWSLGVEDPHPGDHDTPWSAAFISWCMRTGGVGSAFHYSGRHSDYIYRAIQDKLNGSGTSFFLGYRLKEYAPQVGDLVCWARQAGISYENQNHGAYAGHSDLVVAVNNGNVEVIGGNVSNSVTRRPLPTDSQGHLLPTPGGHAEYLIAVMENKLV